MSNMESGVSCTSLLIFTLLASLISVLIWWRRLVAQAVLTWTASEHQSDVVLLPLPPGTLGLPWVGESVPYLAAIRAGDHDRFLRERSALYSSHTFKTLIFNHKTVVLQGAAANRFIATSENKGLLRNAWPSSMLNIVGRGAPVALHGAEHRRLRHILLSCLSPSTKLVREAHTLTHLHFSASHDLWTHGHQLKLVPVLKHHAFRLACKLLINISDEHVLSCLLPNFDAWLTGMLDLPLDLPGTNYHRARLAGDVLRNEIRGIIDRKLKEQLMKTSRSNTDSFARRAHDDDDEEEEDVLSLLLKAQDERTGFLSQAEMEDVLLFLLFAGHDTTTAALIFTLKFLEQNPECLERVVQEQEEIASQKQAGERLNWGDVQRMRYTWRVIQETMRLRPPVTAGIKEAMKDLVFEGYCIPRGWKVYFSITSSHSDDRNFPDANTFNPSRFEAQIPPFAYVPFGVGPHTCPGNEFARMSICVYLHELVRHFKWASLKADERVSISTFPTLVEGYPVTIIQKKPILPVS